jgi:CheY-like chemotaxis protein/HPt (histidine-containing phosphotransfer) domain-containing protein
MDEAVPKTWRGDVTRLRQIIVNLLGNAVKFTEQGEVFILISAYRVAGGRAEQLTHQIYELHFAVKDTGIGIPPERMERLFQSFSQVDASTTRHYGGTGLGLAISNRLSEIMGGTMWVESKGIPGQGSTFHFMILAEAIPTPPQGSLPERQPDLVGKHLLIVDDNETNRRILAHQAQAWGMLPQAAGSGSQALAWLRQGGAFDIAILDMQMPEMDGLTLAAEIRRMEMERKPKNEDGSSKSEMQSSVHQGLSSKLPLVILTSLGRHEEAARAPELDFAAFLYKPIKQSQLHDVLLGIFAKQAGQVQLPSTQPSLDLQMAKHRPLRILLAEDNVVNQKVALHLLGRLGYRIDIAGNGLEALEALNRQPYDVVLMDMQMPEMDGLEATRRICQNWPEDQRPRIIAMTANAMPGDRERCLEAGMDDYISKPVRMEELVRALSQCQAIGNQTDTKAEVAEIIDSALPPPAPSTSDGPTESLLPANGSLPALDSEVLETLLTMIGENVEDVLAELIENYLEDTPLRLKNLRQGLVEEKLHEFERMAHTIKSSSAIFGAMTLSDLCNELETMGRLGTLEGAAEIIQRVEAEYEKVKTALNSLIKQTLLLLVNKRHFNDLIL